MTIPVVNGFDGAAALRQAERERDERRAREAAERERQSEIEAQYSIPFAKTGRRKLNYELAKHIRRLHAAYDLTHRELAEQFGVSRPAIGYVIRGEIYRERAS